MQRLDIYNKILMQTLTKMKVLLLAGGFERDLKRKTELKPKPMVEIGGKQFFGIL